MSKRARASLRELAPRDHATQPLPFSDAPEVVRAKKVDAKKYSAVFQALIENPLSLSRRSSRQSGGSIQLNLNRLFNRLFNILFIVVWDTL